MKNVLILTTIGSVLVPLCLCQGQRSSFDVASIKPSKTKDDWVWDAPPGGRMIARNTTLKTLVRIAWRVQDFQVVGGPNWLSKDQFDIEAKAEGRSSISNEEAREMLAELLTERFQLRVHKETRNRPVYFLKIVKNGPPLSADQVSPSDSGPPPDPNGAMPRGALRMGRGAATGNAVPIPLLARFLGQALDRPVVDETGLQGRYDIEVHWTPDDASSGSAPSGPDLADGPSLFTALQEQLGLKLESGTGPVEVIVVESAEKPLAN